MFQCLFHFIPPSSSFLTCALSFTSFFPPRCLIRLTAWVSRLGCSIPNRSLNHPRRHARSLAQTPSQSSVLGRSLGQDVRFHQQAPLSIPGRAGGCPPTPPQTRTSRFPAYGSSEAWFRKDRVNHFGWWEIPEVQQTLHPLPRHAAVVAVPPVQPISPLPYDVPAKGFQTP